MHFSAWVGASFNLRRDAAAFLLGLVLPAAFLILGDVGEGQSQECELKYPLTCPEGSQACEMNISPVCASDGQESKTFSSCCSLTAFACKFQGKKEFRVVKQGACGPTKRGCMEDCKPYDAPICAEDRRREKSPFFNECYLRAANCGIKDKSKRFQVAYSGRCDTPAKSRC